jgi:hypothetical protein
MHYYATKQYRYPGTPASNGTNRNLLLFRDPRWTASRPATPPRPATAWWPRPSATSPVWGQRRLLSIVLGAASENARANESQKLLNWGYTAFEAVKLFDAGQAVATPPSGRARTACVKLGREEAIVVAVPAGSAGKITTQVARPDPLVAPFTKGQAIGTLKVMLGDQPVLRSAPGGAGRPLSRPASWAAPGMPFVCGSSSETARWTGQKSTSETIAGCCLVLASFFAANTCIPESPCPAAPQAKAGLP